MKLFKRLIAYFIDMMVVLIIVQTISNIPFINKNIDKYNKLSSDYMTTFTEYSSFMVDLDKYYENEELTNKEYKKLVENNPKYEDIINKYYQEDKLTKKNYKKLLSKVEDLYLKEYKDTYYKLDKYSFIYNITYVIVTLLYFIGFNIITDGVTLGKKLVRLKIVNNKDRNSKVSLISYLIRYLIIYEPIYYLFKIIFINILSTGSYFTISNIIFDVHSYMLFIVLAFISIRKDGRGL